VSVGDEQAGEPSDVDDFIPESWPTEAIQALASWSQGCLLPGSILGFADVCQFESVPAFEPDPEVGADPDAAQTRDPNLVLDVAATVFDPNGRMIVLTQTCDLMLTGTGAGQPFAMCSPLVDISGLTPNKIQSIRDWTVTYLAPIENVTENGVWAVDLRVAVPVSKIALVGMTPVQGFPLEADLLRFSDFVALRARRPALHDALSADLRDILNDTIKNAPKGTNDWYLRVEQVRLDIAPSRLQPEWVRVHVLCDRALIPDEQLVWLTCEKKVKALFTEHNITYGGLQFDVLAQVTAEGYRQWSPLAIPRLNRPPFW